MRTVWGGRVAGRGSTSTDAGSAGSVPQIGLFIRDLAPEAPPGTSAQIMLPLLVLLIQLAPNSICYKGWLKKVAESVVDFSL